MSQKHDNELIIRLLAVMENRKKKVTDLARETGIPKDRVYKWLQEGNNPKREDAIKLEGWIGGGKMEEAPKKQEQAEPSPMQILAVLAQAFADQAAMMKSIESKMAQQVDQLAIKEKVQATEARTERIESSLGAMEDQSSVAANLNFVVATVKKLSEIQNQAAAGLLDSSSQIEPAQKASLKDEYSSSGQIDGDGRKRGKPRAKRK